MNAFLSSKYCFFALAFTLSKLLTISFPIPHVRVMVHPFPPPTDVVTDDPSVPRIDPTAPPVFNDALRVHISPLRGF